MLESFCDYFHELHGSDLLGRHISDSENTRTVDAECIRGLHVTRCALAEDAHAVQEVLEGHVAAVVRGEHLADARRERVRLRRVSNAGPCGKRRGLDTA